MYGHWLLVRTIWSSWYPSLEWETSSRLILTKFLVKEMCYLSNCMYISSEISWQDLFHWWISSIYSRSFLRDCTEYLKIVLGIFCDLFNLRVCFILSVSMFYTVTDYQTNSLTDRSCRPLVLFHLILGKN